MLSADCDKLMSDPAAFLCGGEMGALMRAHDWGAEHDRSEALAAGFDDHLTKPAGLDEIDALLARLAPH